MNVVGIIQARMSASRLPGKVLKDIEGQPMLARVYERAQRAGTLNLLAVATTVDPADDLAAAFCAGRGYPCFRGSMHDVLDRYYQAARFYEADVIVRITADCPVIDPVVVDETVRLVTSNQLPVTSDQFDFACNRLPPPFSRTFPIGLDVEVCTFAALERAWREADQKFHREHVMPYLYEGIQLSAASDRLQTGTSPRGFKIAQLHTSPDYGSLRWTVDTPEDLDFIRQVYARFVGRDDFSWQDVLALVQHEPELSQINAGVRHKTLTEIDSRATGH